MFDQFDEVNPQFVEALNTIIRPMSLEQAVEMAGVFRGFIERRQKTGECICGNKCLDHPSHEKSDYTALMVLEEHIDSFDAPLQ